jgi:hypothetical protein
MRILDLFFEEAPVYMGKKASIIAHSTATIL